MVVMHLQDALEQFQVQLRADGRSPHTRRQYERHVRALIGWLSTTDHGRDVEDPSPAAIAEFLASEAATGLPLPCEPRRRAPLLANDLPLTVLAVPRRGKPGPKCSDCVLTLLAPRARCRLLDQLHAGFWHVAGCSYAFDVASSTPARSRVSLHVVRDLINAG